VKLVARAWAPALVGLALVGFVAVRLIAAHSAAPAPAAMFSADIVIPAGSMAAPDFSGRDQDNQVVSMSGLRGRVVALTFMFSHCQSLCPIEAEQLARVQKTLGAATPVSLVVVSVDPANDTPGSVRAFAATHGWTGDWHWVLGTPAQLAPIWKAYSVGVQPASGDILHTLVLFLIDKNGYQRGGFASGLTPSTVSTDIRLLAAERSS